MGQKIPFLYTKLYNSGQPFSPQKLFLFITSSAGINTILILWEITLEDRKNRIRKIRNGKIGTLLIAEMTYFEYINGITVGSIAATLATDVDRNMGYHWLGLVAFSALTLLMAPGHDEAAIPTHHSQEMSFSRLPFLKNKNPSPRWMRCFMSLWKVMESYTSTY
jgi:hypothetical protein